MNCKSCKNYDRGWDGFCTLYPTKPLRATPLGEPRMICDGNDYENIKSTEVDIVGEWHIEKGEKVYILKHYLPMGGYTPYEIDGVFYDINVANRAMRICQADKPNWKFIIDSYKITTDIYK